MPCRYIRNNDSLRHVGAGKAAYELLVEGMDRQLCNQTTCVERCYCGFLRANGFVAVKAFEVETNERWLLSCCGASVW